ncbi:SDR family oxidoreductase [Acidovorax sp. sif1233]|uniref:SDR family NAD(P)-dependent oxidoreductase n=1 Tax=unclassified Acidovorax TaxID=2684926 RepID=UPI001C449F6A|nr:SDR family NAD(P)-dependent oxidoreductase [Acidovorax sp. sif1233]MBV7455133.1 SDR family oxidoreductase [Acidovorax sp. sif1233]
MAKTYFEKNFGLQGRVACVTGSAAGLGLAIARHLGQAGARIVVNDLDAGRCEEAVRLLTVEGVEARHAVFDVSQAEAVGQAIDTLAFDGWAPDIMVSNAGNQNRKLVTEMTLVQWQSLFDVHVNGAFNCAHAVLPHMTRKGFGRIILMSSVAGQACMPGIAAYASAKGAIAAFTRALAVEYGSAGVNSNALAPGFVRTQFTQGLQEREGFDSFLQSAVPIGRWAEPDDIAPAVVYLASNAGSFVNGHVLAIDGGMLARM